MFGTTYNQLLDPVYTRLPTGVVKPHGWGMNMAQVLAHGLASEQPLWYSYVKDSIWQGGMLEYSEMQEAAPYWFNSWVALAYQLRNDTLIGYTENFLDHVLASRHPSGNFGPDPFNTSLPVLLWPRYLVMLGLIQHAEADPARKQEICDLMHAFVPYATKRFADGDIGDEDLGGQYGFQVVRWEELVLVLQWLYDNDPRGKEQQLVALMRAAQTQGFSWKRDFYVDNGTFPRLAVLPAEDTQERHGVNIAESLKSEALVWRVTGDPSDIASTYARIEMLWKYHGRPQGIFSTDEHLGGLHPSRGTELCASVEAMFSLEYMYAILGEPAWADLTEKIAYNAVPAQYLHQTNQIAVANRTGPTPWTTDGPYSNVLGMEPEFPCCTVNHAQAWPKFWANSFLLARRGRELVHALLGPAKLSVELEGGAHVNVTVDTLYPFGETLTYTISASAPFTFHIRIPGWAKAASSLSINDQPASALTHDPKTALQTVSVPASNTTIRLYLDMQIEVEERSNGSVAVHRGPLFYAVDLAYNETLTPARRASGPLRLLNRLPGVPDSDLQLVSTLY
ncbi:hypothetical protein EVJ58_g10129 [Rhodofomes roseus]|uniref:Beta-L-arabinofuranosidase (Glycosyl hydrolase family 127) n=1 Tax=Rhodofomes roseus TaxID=34475 RepID=A0A4Y9XQ59_9APHY|nr:hypothetical protein EVJ58_g10129 [Rhodofomes roseus]